jgi:hypothetical protein
MSGRERYEGRVGRDHENRDDGEVGATSRQASEMKRDGSSDGGSDGVVRVDGDDEGRKAREGEAQ